jgi:hypothetical protein
MRKILLFVSPHPLVISGHPLYGLQRCAEKDSATVFLASPPVFKRVGAGRF